MLNTTISIRMKMSRDIESNYHKSIKLIQEAAEKGAQLVMFPEIQLTPFFPQYADMDVSDYVMTFDNALQLTQPNLTAFIIF